MSGSRNSFLGFVIVSCFGIFLGLYRWISRREFNKKLAIATVMMSLLLSSLLLNNIIPTRAKQSLNQYTSLVQITDLYKSIQNIYGLPTSLGGFGQERKQVYYLAIETWKKFKWTGIGIGSFSYYQKIGPGFNTHNFILSIFVEQGLIGMFFIILFFAIMVFQMKNWTGSLLLIIVPFTLILDDLSWSYIFPVYLSILLGICFHYILRRKNSDSDLI